MVYITSKVTLGFAVGALLAFSHIQAAPARDRLTAQEEKVIDDNYNNKIFQPTKDHHLCKARCYTEHLYKELKSVKNFFEEVASLDSCVDEQLANIKTYDDLKKNYEDKKELWNWNMGQFCADVVTGKGQVPLRFIYKIPAIQAGAVSCSSKHCDKPFNDAQYMATLEAMTEAQKVLMN